MQQLRAQAKSPHLPSRSSFDVPGGGLIDLNEPAPAKVNLTLRVLGRRPGDGYHVLDSLVVFARNAVDDVRFEPASGRRSHRDENAADGWTTVTGPRAGLLVTDGAGNNLIDRAYAAVRAASPRCPMGRFHLTKRLAVAAGIGGGSADAAAALRLLRRAAPELDTEVDWARMALSIGADVPVCFENTPATMRGIGARVLPVNALPEFYAVLANPGYGVSTAAVFAALAAPVLAADGERDVDDNSTPEFANFEALISWVAERSNDLEAPALQLAPTIAEVRDALRRLPGQCLVRMSGSGATWFALFASGGEAEHGAKLIASAHPNWWVIASRLG